MTYALPLLLFFVGWIVLMRLRRIADPRHRTAYIILVAIVLAIVAFVLAK